MDDIQMKLAVYVGELYPALFVTFPGEQDYDWEVKHNAVEVPDELAERYRKASNEFREVEGQIIAKVRGTE
jgi:hypothetical protein